MKHHFRDSDRGFGVTTTIWDWVFGTNHVLWLFIVILCFWEIFNNISRMARISEDYGERTLIDNRSIEKIVEMVENNRRFIWRDEIKYVFS